MFLIKECILAEEMNEVSGMLERLKLLTKDEEQELSYAIFFNFEHFVVFILNYESGNTEIKGIQKFIIKQIAKDPLLKQREKVFNYSVDRIRSLTERFPKNTKYKYAMERMDFIKIASSKFIKHNFRLVLSIAIAIRKIKEGLSLRELFQYGNIGLIKSSFRFDYSFGYRFSTYATLLIRREILRAIGNYSRTIRIPIHVVKKKNEIEQERDYLFRKACEKSEEETLDVIDVPQGTFCCSLHDLVSTTKNGGGIILEDLIEGTEPLQDEKAIENEVSCIIKKVLKTLTPREEEVIRMRYGMGEEQDHTLEEVGKKFGVTRERIRQIEKKALKKLQHPTRKEKLKEVFY